MSFPSGQGPDHSGVTPSQEGQGEDGTVSVGPYYVDRRRRYRHDPEVVDDFCDVRFLLSMVVVPCPRWAPTVVTVAREDTERERGDLDKVRRQEELRT